MKRSSKTIVNASTPVSPMKSPVTFRSKRSINKVSRPSASSGKDSSATILPIYTLDYCLGRLDCYLSKNIPLSRNCAFQIKRYLMQSLNAIQDENCITQTQIRQKTELLFEDNLKENKYIEAVHQTDYELYKSMCEKTPQKKLKKRPFAQIKRPTVTEDQFMKDIQNNCDQKILKYQQILEQKDKKIRFLSKENQLLQTKMEQITDLKNSLQKSQKQTLNLKDRELDSFKNQLRETKSRCGILQQFIQERETQLLYLWRTSICPSL